MLGSKFMYGTTGYAGGESELQMVTNLPSPADKDQRQDGTVGPKTTIPPNLSNIPATSIPDASSTAR